MLAIIPGTLTACPQKTGPPGRNLIHICLIDTDRKRGQPLCQLAVRDRKHHLLRGSRLKALVLKHQGIPPIPQTVLRPGIIDAHCPSLCTLQRITAPRLSYRT